MSVTPQAIEQSGHAATGTIEVGELPAAPPPSDRGALVSNPKPSGQSAPPTAPAGIIPLSKGRQIKHLAAFMRHLHVLLCSGTSLTQALSALERQTHEPRWRHVIGVVREKIEGGSSFAAALREHPKYFDQITCSLVAAGETSGKLDEMLDRLTTLKQKQLRVRREVVGAMTYPLLVVVVAMGVVSMLVGIVLPRFTALFTALNVPLPPSTRLLMMFGDVLQGYWWLIGSVLIVVGVGAWRGLVSDAGRGLIDTILVYAPGIRPISRNFITARVIRLLGVLLGSHVGLLEALRLTRDSAGNKHYAALLDRAEEESVMGSPLSHVFSESELISPSVYEAFYNGEQSGTLDTLLITVADFMDEDNEVMLRSLLSVLSPAILAVLGLFIGGVAVSLFLPLFDLTASAGGG